MQRMGPFLNMRLLLQQLGKSWLLTLLIVAAVVGLNTFYLSRWDDFTSAEIVVAMLGIVAAMAFLKAVFLFTFYRIFYTSAFDGSFFVIALLITLLLLIPLGTVSSLASSRIEDFPAVELPCLLATAYIAVSVFLFTVFRISHWLFGRVARR